jgi:hypothetical protein
VCHNRNPGGFHAIANQSETRCSGEAQRHGIDDAASALPLSPVYVQRESLRRADEFDTLRECSLVARSLAGFSQRFFQASVCFARHEPMKEHLPISLFRRNSPMDRK